MWIPSMKSLLPLVTLALAACAQPESESPDAAPAPASESESAALCEGPRVRAVVTSFGERLRQVSLLAPDSIVVRELREAYGPVITPSLLEQWSAAPASAPGRDVSSPWPERINIRSMERASGGRCRVEGDIVYATSAGAVDADEPIVIDLVQQDAGWRIDSVERAAGGAEPADTMSIEAASAAGVIRRYYEAIDAGDYRAAYQLWSGEGAASGQTFDEFAAGYRETQDVVVDIGLPGRIEGAAGSRYMALPVAIQALTKGGERQRFEGSYTLRRSVVEGASAAQGSWRIHAAEIRRSSDG